jgi:chorismate dehydratase
MRVCAVSYLNTVPLVWGMLEGPQRGVFDLSFEVPSVCADKVKSGEADIGIIPVATLLEQDLAIFRGAGIACRREVRTILLISKAPLPSVEVLAVDSGSRTSVMLARIILRERADANPALIVMPPRLEEMLAAADAALVIGDAALALNPESLRSRGFEVVDLGAEWVTLSGLPMVFAVWAGRREVHSPEAERVFLDSCRFGLEHLDEIADREWRRRGFPRGLVSEYLKNNIVFELGESEYRGMKQFLGMAAALPPAQFIERAAAELETKTV